MRSKRICAELSRMREDDPAAWGTDPEMERGYALGGRVELLFPDNYPFSPPKMVRGPTARGAMGMEGAFKWACVRARRRSNLCFFGEPDTCPCCVSPCCAWNPSKKATDVVEYAMFLEDCRDHVLCFSVRIGTNENSERNRMMDLPEEMILMIGSKVWT